MTPNPDPWVTILAGSKSAGTAITVRDYADMHYAKDRSKIAGLIRSRFVERYLAPALDNPKRHGFAMLALGCLMVEAMESFRNGWRNSSGKSEAAFCSFFQAHDEFRDLRPVAHEFYRSIRCGILHQAESTDGWPVHRESGLFATNGGVRSVGAWEFCNGLKSVLDRYHDELVAADWADDRWVKTRKKLQAICQNCGLPDAEAAKLS